MILCLFIMRGDARVNTWKMTASVLDCQGQGFSKCWKVSTGVSGSQGRDYSSWEPTMQDEIHSI